MKKLASWSGVVVIALSMITSVCSAGELDIKVRDEATAADAGLPAYPGSKPYKDPDQSSSGANLGFSIPGFGFKVVAMNLQSGDRPERVGAFYRKALSKYGRVLDCSDVVANKKNARSHAEDDEELTCDDDDPGANSIVYKVGTESNHRIVAIRPLGSGTRFSLVHVDTRERASKR